jgi:cytochrome d ubiquinol oxidase subunit II
METLWYCLLVFMLGNYVVLGGTDFGVGMLLPLVARSEAERWQVIRSIRSAWKPNEVWLVASGGTLFLAFPKALAVSFSGFYLALIVVVWLLAFRGLGLELRYHVPDALWRQFWDMTLAISSFLLALFLGTALGNVVRGVPLDDQRSFFEPLWTDFRIGDQTGILDWYTVLVGLTAVIALAHHGALWLSARVDGAVRARASRLASVLVVLVLVLLAALNLASFAARLEFREALHARPWGLLLPLMALGGFGAVMVLRRRGNDARAYLASCAALYATFATAAVGIFPSILPARNPALALSVFEAAAPRADLANTLYWWIPGILLVTGYFAVVHAQMPRRFAAGEEEQ